MPTSSRTTVKLFLLTALVALALPASASGQALASRTWVSGVGSDADPCSRTEPCKTFAGAHDKTAARGEINCLDPGEYGGVVITKSITIKCHYTEAGVLGLANNAIAVNAQATDRIVLRGLDINGFGSGLNGVFVFRAKSLKILDSEIHGFTSNGVIFQPHNANAKLLVHNSDIQQNNGNGVLIAPPNGFNNARGIVRNSVVVNNGCGVVATNHGTTLDPAVDCGTGAADRLGGSANISVFNTALNDHDTTLGATGSAAVFTNGQLSTARIGGNDITGNNFGLRAIDFGLGGIFTFGDNYINGNATNGTPQGTIPKS